MALLKDVNDKVYKIIGACMEVHKTLGPGYSIEYYRKALEVEFEQKELKFESQKPVEVMYKEVMVGSFEVDFVVAEDVVIALRSQDMLKDVEIQQVLRCLNLLECSIGLLVNFGGVKIQYKRILPSHSQAQARKDPYRYTGHREMGKTREGNPVI